ncbi:MAG: WYL domain-containing protein [bacterium]|nr:WYL domain-containing protein [bacterium]
MITWKPIGQLLVEHSYISKKMLDEVLKEQKTSDIYFGDYLLKKKLIRDMKLRFVLEEQSNLSSTAIEKYRYLPFASLQFTVIDILTTGINFEDNARICEFSIMKFKKGEPVSQTRKLIKMDVELPVLFHNVFECAAGINSAENSLDYFAPVLNQLLDNEIIISFSTPFVFDFIFRQIKKKFKISNSVHIDLMTIWRRMKPGPGAGYTSFIKFCKLLGIDVVPPYSSLNNCSIIFQIFQKLIDELRGKAITNLDELIRFQDRNFYFGVNEKIDIPEDISEAISRQESVDIEYYSPWTQERTFRRIDPYEILFRENSAYLLGYCNLRREFRTFRIDRIGKIIKTEKPFIKRKKPDFWTS